MFAVVLLLGMVNVQQPIVVNQPTVVTITDDQQRPQAGKTVRVFYAEGLPSMVEKAVGVSDHEGRVTWAPDRPGIARLVAADQTLRLRVQGGETDPTLLATLGLLGAAILGLLLFGLVRPRRKTT